MATVKRFDLGARIDLIPMARFTGVTPARILASALRSIADHLEYSGFEWGQEKAIRILGVDVGSFQATDTGFPDTTEVKPT